jgi:hypothetical protein
MKNRNTTLRIIPFVLACFALSPLARAVDPPPDGGYPNRNTAEGEDALFSLTTAFDNTAVGFHALYSATNLGGNTAVGSQALSNTTGGGNTAVGLSVLYDNTSGSLNTAIGDSALFSNTTGAQNTAVGEIALYYNTVGTNNTVTGYQALFSNTTGSNNIAIGNSAGFNLTTGSNNIDIGNAGLAADSNKIRIGTRGTQQATFIAGISGKTVANSVPVYINANGQLGTAQSSARFKEGIKPMDKTSEAILALQPVTFRYKPELDPEGIPQFGLVAEDVEKVNPDLVARDDRGKTYTVRYEAVNAMLLNEFLKEHCKVEAQEEKIGELEAALKEQAAQIQKVCAKLEVGKPASQVVANKP